MMDEIQKRLLAEVADLHGVPEGAYNIRANGQMAARNTTANTASSTTSIRIISCSPRSVSIIVCSSARIFSAVLCFAIARSTDAPPSFPIVNNV